MRDDRYIHDGWQPHTHGTHTCVTAVCSLATYYLLVPSGTCTDTGATPVPVHSSQALCATLFFFRNCSSAVAVAVQWQWARSPQCSAACCVLRAACSACCSSVPQLQLCSSSALQWCCCCGGGACACAYTHSQTQSPARGTAHSIVVYILVAPRFKKSFKIRSWVPSPQMP